MHDTDDMMIDDDTDTPRTFSYAAGARVLIGLAGIGGLAYQYNRAQDDADKASTAEASAIQIVQVWTPHLFYAIVIIGIVISLYIASRYAD